MAGSPYYAPPSGAGYGGGYGAPPSQQQQQQQVTVVSSDSRMLYVYPTETYSGAVAYACVVLWCCNCIFGLIAYLLAGELTIFPLKSNRFSLDWLWQKRTPASRYIYMRPASVSLQLPTSRERSRSQEQKSRKSLNFDRQ